jgi:hypothetical protein
MLLSLFLSITLLSINRLTISYNWPLVTTYELLLLILVSLPILEVITAVNSVVTATLGGILFDFFYRNYSSNCVTIPSRSTIVGALIG